MREQGSEFGAVITREIGHMDNGDTRILTTNAAVSCGSRGRTPIS